MFHKHIVTVAEKHGLYRWRGKPQLFVDTTTNALVYVHVNYLMVIGPAHVVKRIRESLTKELVIKWESAISAQQPEKYLGKLWQRTADGGMSVRVEQSYWEKGMSLCYMEYCRGVTTVQHRWMRRRRS